MKTVIIAAGNGSRLQEQTNDIPKTLLPYENGTILSTIIGNFKKNHIHKFVMVLGYKSMMIQDYLIENNYFSCSFEFIINPQWTRGNGISAFLAHQAIAENKPFILSMADHIVTPEALEIIIQSPNPKNLLLTDRNIQRCVDIDDATKVKTAGSQIKAIGKHLTDYNAIDCGIFKLNSRFFNAMELQIEQGKESISEGVNQLILQEDFDAVFMSDSSRWIDIDTPMTYEYATRHKDEFIHCGESS